MDHGGGMTMMGMAPGSDQSAMPMPRRKMMMHMTLYWGTDALVLFERWPGTSLVMYLLSLLLVFCLSLLVEWLAFCPLARPRTPGVAAGILQTVVYALRVGLAYLVMLALMSFNTGILLVAVAGHAIGFLLFGSVLSKRHKNENMHHNMCP